jgi:tRNA(Ile)-lysidine synthase
MIHKVKNAIQKHGMLDKGERVIVAVSGGPDSVTLLKVLAMFTEEYGLTLITAHLNHGLRKEACDEEQFVRSISEDMGIAFECRSVDINSLRKGTGKSIEDISREVRYQFLNEVVRKRHAQKIALGHNLNDQIETVLINFLRGSGPEGLKGMMPVRDSLYIRPLLCISSQEILSFIESHKMQYVTDASNTESVYLRNRIRHSLIPQLKKYNPNLEKSLNNMAKLMCLQDEYMKTVAHTILSEWNIIQARDEVRISISALRMYHEAVQNQVVKELLRKMTPDGQGIGYAHIKAVVDLCFSDHPGGYVDLPHAIVVRRAYDSLIISRGMKSKQRSIYEKRDEIHYEVTFPGSVYIVELGKTLHSEFVKHPDGIYQGGQNTVFMDYDRIIAPVIIRTAKPGDRIQPLGMRGTKKIKSYFIDEKVPINVRNETLLLLDQESVIWIAGMRLSERVKISNKTRRVLKVEIV